MRLKAIAAAVAASLGETAHLHLTRFMAEHGLVRYVDPPVAAPAAPAAPAPAAPAAPAAAAAPAPAPVAAGADPAAPASLVGDASTDPAAPKAAEVPVVVPIDDAKKYLTDKGVKAEDLAKLDEAGVRAKYDELKAAEGKPVDPKSIELKLPDGFEMQEAELNTFREILADANLSPQDRGQKLVDLHVAAMKAAVDEPMRLFAKMQSDWQAEVMADKVIGGQNWKATEKAIAGVLDKFAGAQGTPEGKAVREAFKFTGAGNNPAIVRLMANISKLVTEGSSLPGNPPSAGSSDKQVLATMYPSAQPAK